MHFLLYSHGMGQLEPSHDAIIGVHICMVQYHHSTFVRCGEVLFSTSAAPKRYETVRKRSPLRHLRNTFLKHSYCSKTVGHLKQDFLGHFVLYFSIQRQRDSIKSI